MEEKVEKKGKLYFLITFIICIVVAFGSFALGVQYAKQNKTNNIISCSYAVDNQATLSDTEVYSQNWDYGFGTFIKYSQQNAWYYPLFVDYFSVDATDYLDNTYFLNFQAEFYYMDNHNGSFYWDMKPTDSTFSGTMELSLNFGYNSALDSNVDFFTNLEFKGYNRYDNNVGLSKWCALWYSYKTGGLGRIIGCDFGIQSLTDISNKTFYIPNSWGIPISDTSLKYFVLSMFDTDGNRITFSLVTDISNLDTYWNRFYFLDGVGDNYEDGYNTGLQVGRNEGANDGYMNGYNSGYVVGKNEGYNLGLEDGSDYSFLGLVSATIDAPIQAFRGLFNFSIFGVNMSQFMLSLFSIAIVFVIVRFVLAKKE